MPPQSAGRSQAGGAEVITGPEPPLPLLLPPPTVPAPEPPWPAAAPAAVPPEPAAPPATVPPELAARSPSAAFCPQLATTTPHKLTTNALTSRTFMNLSTKCSRTVHPFARLRRSRFSRYSPAPSR